MSEPNKNANGEYVYPLTGLGEFTAPEFNLISALTGLFREWQTLDAALRAELTEAREEAAELARRVEAAGVALFAHRDTDHDGTISHEELVRAVADAGRALVTGEVRNG